MCCWDCSGIFDFWCLYFNGLYTEPWSDSKTLSGTISILFIDNKTPQCRLRFVDSVLVHNRIHTL